MKLERQHLISVIKHLQELGQYHEEAKRENDAQENSLAGWGDYCHGYAEGMRASIGFIEAILTHTEDEE